MTYFIDKSKEISYFKIPFSVCENVSKIKIKYDYKRFENDEEINIVDIGLEAPNNNYVGWSGSNSSEFYVCEYSSSQGYSNIKTEAGEWNLLIGAYKICDDGVDVKFDISFEYKERTLIFGDTHMHTKGSDGVFSLDELVNRAKINDLDFIIITDHNNYAQNLTIPNYDGLVVIPGTELTHYNGHIGLLGAKNPFEKGFFHNDEQQLNKLLEYAKSKGAIISLNHPCCQFCGFKWDIKNVPFDLIEVWNGTMSKRNYDAINLWHSLLLSGKKINIIGGSDFHRPTFGLDIGMPAIGVYTNSKEKNDILNSIINGNSFITYFNKGPAIDCLHLGQNICLNDKFEVKISNAQKGDKLLVYYNDSVEEFILNQKNSSFNINADKLGFIRFEILRNYITELRQDIACISNAIYIRS